MFADCNKRALYETWRQTSLPPRRRGFAPRIGPFDDPAGTGCGDEERDRPRFEPGLSLANREWRPAPSDAHNTRAAGAILPRLSRLSGGRPGRLYARLAVGIACHRREGRFLAVCRRRTIHGGPGVAECHQDGRAARTVPRSAAIAFGNFADAWTVRAAQ